MISLRSPYLLVPLVAIGAACARSVRPAPAGVVVPAAGALPLKYTPRPTEAPITAGDLMSRLYLFADDSMQGREAGTVGHVQSTQYIADQLRALGLEPAGENGTYFQRMPLVTRRLDTTAAFGVEGRAFVPFREYLAWLPRGTPRTVHGVPTVFAGALGETAPAVTAEQLAGKVAVYRATTASASIPSQAQGAAAVVVVMDQLPAQLINQARVPAITMPAGASTAAPSRATIYLTTAAAEALFGGPIASVAPGTAGKAFTRNLPFAEVEAPARNVIAVLRGSDPALRNTYVAVGAHSDHVGYRVGQSWDHDSLRLVNSERNRLRMALGQNPTPDQVRAVQQQMQAFRPNLDSVRALRPARRDSIFNGADDDGSGSVGVLEIAEALAKAPSRPKRSILFVWHTAEEKGLLGSRWFSEHPTVPRDSIVAQVNIDMIGRGGAADIAGGGPNYLQVIGAGRLATELRTLVEQVNRERTTPLVFDYTLDAPGHPENIYCRSDHYHYARWGIPVVFFWTGLHGDYHQITDEPQYIDYGHMERVSRYLNDVVLRLANREQRLTIDQPKLDPNGSCRQ